MQAERPAKLTDPVCGTSVDVAPAEVRGLLLEHGDHTYGFCGDGCRRAFVDSPVDYLAAAEAALAAAVVATGVPAIDESMRRWYESCSCCLSDAYPEIKAQLDAERAAAAQAQPDAGICEAAERAGPGSST